MKKKRGGPKTAQRYRKNPRIVSKSETVPTTPEYDTRPSILNEILIGVFL
jgi:hypothetical protein